MSLSTDKPTIPWPTDSHYWANITIEDRETGLTRIVCPYGRTAQEIVDLITNPVLEFAPVPPAPPPGEPK